MGLKFPESFACPSSRPTAFLAGRQVGTSQIPACGFPARGSSMFDWIQAWMHTLSLTLGWAVGETVLPDSLCHSFLTSQSYVTSTLVKGQTLPAPSLHGNYPASSILWAGLTSNRPHDLLTLEGLEIFHRRCWISQVPRTCLADMPCSRTPQRPRGFSHDRCCLRIVILARPSGFTNIFRSSIA